MKQWMRGGKGITVKDRPSSGAVRLQRHFQLSLAEMLRVQQGIPCRANASARVQLALQSLQAQGFQPPGSLTP